MPTNITYQVPDKKAKEIIKACKELSEEGLELKPKDMMRLITCHTGSSELVKLYLKAQQRMSEELLAKKMKQRSKTEELEINRTELND